MSERTVPISMGSDARTLDELGLIAPLTSAEYATVREQCGTSEHEMLARAIEALRDVQWRDGFCPQCWWGRINGHASRCNVGNVLAAYDATHPTAGV